jgi:diaminohydroxyphosphoribosylaminopyrimidine deaminase/5-amino-6-(5-phosphoribosylamino)uracil reductase
MTNEQYMQRCLELAQRGAGSVAPNPMVGAVLVHNGRIIGEGWHMQYGQAHAEVACFESIATADKHLIPQSVMYVSLEPCAHTGKTPPCAQRIVAEGVKEVVIASRDPFAQVNGAGIRILEAAGIRVHTARLEAAGSWLNRRFFTFHRQQRPYIILKWAQSAEGFIARATKERTPLSNSYSSTLVHKWRTEEAAIMVGYRTALHDLPRLTARHWPGRQPLRLVTDRLLTLPSTHPLYNTEAPTWILNEQKNTTEAHIRFVQLGFSESILPGLMHELYLDGRLSLIVEGGAALLQSFIAAGLWDEARLFKTATGVNDGIPAPQLKQATLAMETQLATDTLQLWVNKESRYPYTAGMSL